MDNFCAEYLGFHPLPPSSNYARRGRFDVEGVLVAEIGGPEEYPRKPPVLWTDFLMLGLAVVSVVLVAWVTFWTVPEQTYRTIVVVDTAICAIFAVEFLLRWRREGWPWSFPFVYWYEVLGMIPVTSPFFRSFRLLRIVVVVVRLARVADRAFGDRITAALVNRFVGTIVETVKRPVTMAVMEEVAGVLRTGHFTRNIANALEENRAEIDQMIVEVIRNDPQIGRIRYVPFHEDIIRTIADASFRVVFQVLADPRTDELVGDVLRENVNQMREAVKEGVRVPESIDHRDDPTRDRRIDPGRLA